MSMIWWAPILTLLLPLAFAVQELSESESVLGEVLAQGDCFDGDCEEGSGAISLLQNAAEYIRIQTLRNQATAKTAPSHLAKQDTSQGPEANNGGCHDDNSDAVTIAAEHGIQITGCEDLKDSCNDADHGELARHLCPVTCGVCPGVTQTDVVKESAVLRHSERDTELTEKREHDEAKKNLKETVWAITAEKQSPSGMFREGDIGHGELIDNAMTITWASGKKTKTKWPNPEWFSAIKDPTQATLLKTGDCRDNDEDAMKLASGRGLSAKSCHDLKDYCADVDQGRLARDLCPVTCGTCASPYVRQLDAESGSLAEIQTTGFSKMSTDQSEAHQVKSKELVDSLLMKQEECVDDDVNAIKLAAEYGLSVTSCVGLLDYCGNPKFRKLDRHVCPVTCGACPTMTQKEATLADQDDGHRNDSGNDIPSASLAQTDNNNGIDCVDDDTNAIKLAAERGIVVSGCPDLKQFCGDPRYGKLDKKVCPVTCNVCQEVRAVGLMGTMQTAESAKSYTKSPMSASSAHPH